jgi:hypothetical protein
MAFKRDLYVEWTSAMLDLGEAQVAYNARWEMISHLREKERKHGEMFKSIDFDLKVIGDDEVRRPIHRNAEKKWKEAEKKVRDAMWHETIMLEMARQVVREAYHEYLSNSA